MKRRDICLLAGILGAFPALPLLLGSTLATAPDDELMSLTHRADAAFIGELVGHDVGVSHGAWTVTLYTFERVDWLKGGDRHERYVVAVEGGTIGERTTRIAGAADLEPGNEYLLFLSHNGNAPLPFVDGMGGVIEFEPEGHSAGADGLGNVWLENIHGQAYRRSISPRPLPSGALLDRVRGFRTLLDAEELVTRVRTAANRDTPTSIRTLTEGGFDGYQPG